MFKYLDWIMFGLKLNKYVSKFHPLEDVGRGSDTHLQVGENLNYITLTVEVINDGMFFRCKHKTFV